MKQKLGVVFVVLCFVQFFLIVLLGVRIASKTDNFTSFIHKIWMIPRSKNAVVHPEVSTLKYYYEPKASSTTTYDLSFVGMNKKVVQTINADGLNERYDYPVEKEDSVYRIITLGDSFTEGALVETKDNWTERLEDMLNTSVHCTNISKFEVINLGVAGYDMQYSLERFKQKGLKYSADLVLFFAGQDDFDFSNELLIEKVNRITKELESNADMLQRYREKEGDMYPAYDLAYKELLHEKGDGVQQTMLRTEYVSLNQLIDSVAGTFVVSPYKRLPETMMTTIQAYVADHKNAYYFPYVGDVDRFGDGHPTPVGHETIAGYFSNSLLQAKIIPCDEQK